MILTASLPSQSAQVTAQTTISFLDLEVNEETQEIYRYGLVTPDGANLNVCSERDDLVLRALQDIQSSFSLLCGHHIRRFDHPHLLKKWADLSKLRLIDTLELSVVAFPLEPSHRLSKRYKPSQLSSNNPLEDAKACRELLEQIRGKLAELPQEFRSTLIWLLSCGQSQADIAYRSLFQMWVWPIEVPKEQWQLPDAARCNVSDQFLAQLWHTGLEQDFETRFLAAALLAHNYAKYTEGCCTAVSPWLQHLPNFRQQCDQMFPLLTEEFSYHYYLEKFGWSQFHENQEEIIRSIVAGKTTFAMLATGGGKSLCYQLPTLMLYDRQNALSVCISPLQALMDDQYQDLQNNGLGFSTFINGNLSQEERQRRLEQVKNGKVGLLYISPEQLRSSSIRSLLRYRPPAFWIVDEAHCMNQWGHDFRPDYRYLTKFIQEFYQDCALPRIAMFTATATDDVRADLRQLFAGSGIAIEQEFTTFAQRDNLRKVIKSSTQKTQDTLRLVQMTLQEPGAVIVYTALQKETEGLAAMLKSHGITADYYHGGMPKEEKKRVLEAFKQKEVNVVVATCAFGMGINRADVRAVIHHHLPSSLEAYEQEVGRAGRDRQPANCTLLFDGKDLETNFFLKSQSELCEAELKNIFLAIRAFREKIQGKPRSSNDDQQEHPDYFTVSVDELRFGAGLVNGQTKPKQREQQTTKLLVGIHYLEEWGLVSRSENACSYLQYHFPDCQDLSAVLTKFYTYAEGKAFPMAIQEDCQRLIQVLYALQNSDNSSTQQLPLSNLSDETGISFKRLLRYLNELEQAGICSSEVPQQLLISKGVGNSASDKLKRIQKVETTLYERISQSFENQSRVVINLHKIVREIQLSNKEVPASLLFKILQAWQDRGWIRFQLRTKSVIDVFEFDQTAEIQDQQHLASTIIDVIFQDLGQKRGGRLRWEYTLPALLSQVKAKCEAVHFSEEELNDVMYWLHCHDVIRLTDSISLMRQNLKLKVIPKADVRTVTREFPKLQQHYEAKTRKIHLVKLYAEKPEAEREAFLNDYLNQSVEEFSQRYPESNDPAFARPLLQEDFEKIMGCLNPAQRDVVESDSPAMLVIAGPGSGKTRTIVHRIAYLIQVKRVQPERILALAYNRNAVKEIKTRLVKLIGERAYGIKVQTFHGLSLSLLDRPINPDENFDQLIINACQHLENNEDPENLGFDLHRLQLLGDLEYLFVDEYQDVSEKEYRLIRLIAGLGQDETDKKATSINLCVIGDDDQNIYQFRGTSPQYIRDFQEEYQAKKFLLVENYRSTESIIRAANSLIQHNSDRCKQLPKEQVQIDAERQGLVGQPVIAPRFRDVMAQAVWIVEQVQMWLESGVPANEIAILSFQWDSLNPARMLLEKAEIPTQALNHDRISLAKHHSVSKLLDLLKHTSMTRTLAPTESVYQRIYDRYLHWDYSTQEVATKAVLHIAKMLDEERQFGSEMAQEISSEEIISTIYEVSHSKDSFLDRDAVLVTSAHTAKGLEFKKAILLCDNFYGDRSISEETRRLFYVAITRAKDELILAHTENCVMITEMGIESNTQIHPMDVESKRSQWIYLDLDPSDIWLGFDATKNNRQLIEQLRDGQPIQLKYWPENSRWKVVHFSGRCIGALSTAGSQKLSALGLSVNRQGYLDCEVLVGAIYQQDDNEKILSWPVVIPKIRSCGRLTNSFPLGIAGVVPT
jgi:ATP-dependent DNA helicase RecQ